MYSYSKYGMEDIDIEAEPVNTWETRIDIPAGGGTITLDNDECESFLNIVREGNLFPYYAVAISRSKMWGTTKFKLVERKIEGA